jgi:ribonuclease-3
VARDWRVGAVLRLGDSERMNGGAEKTAILGDVCEAIIGAVFLDAGYAGGGAISSNALLGAGACDSQPRRPLPIAKTTLQEWAQARGLPTPAYRHRPPAPAPTMQPKFVIAVEVEGLRVLPRPRAAPVQASPNSAAAVRLHAPARACSGHEGVLS